MCCIWAVWHGNKSPPDSIGFPGVPGVHDGYTCEARCACEFLDERPACVSPKTTHAHSHLRTADPDTFGQRVCSKYDGVPCVNDPTKCCYNADKWCPSDDECVADNGE